MSLSARWHAPVPAPVGLSRRPSGRSRRWRGLASGWWIRMGDDREMVGLKLAALAALVALALIWEVPGWPP